MHWSRGQLKTGQDGQGEDNKSIKTINEVAAEYNAEGVSKVPWQQREGWAQRGPLILSLPRRSLTYVFRK